MTFLCLDTVFFTETVALEGVGRGEGQPCLGSAPCCGVSGALALLPLGTVGVLHLPSD